MQKSLETPQWGYRIMLVITESHAARKDREVLLKYLRVYTFHKTTTSSVKIMVSSLGGLFSTNCEHKGVHVTKCYKD